MLFSPQRFTYCRAGVCFRHGIKVAVDVGGSAHIAMSEPFLDLLHGNALGKKYRGAGMAKVVEADLLQIMLLQELSEVSGDEVGIIQPPEGIHADVSLSPLLLSPSSFSLITIGGLFHSLHSFFKNFQNHIDNPLFLCYTIIG